MKINQAVILCGGIGKRLMPLTKHRPKPMVLINKKPFLEYLILLLKKNNVTNILILGGYKNQIIKKYFKNGKKLGVNIDYYNGPSHWDTGTRIFKAQKMIHNTFMLLYSDNILSLNFKKHLLTYKKKDLHFLLTRKINGNFLLNKKYKNIQNYSITRRNNYQFIELGFSIFKKKPLIKFFNNTKKKSINEYFENRIKKKKISFSIHEDIYSSIGDYKRYFKAKIFLKPKKIIFIDRDGTINKSPGKGKYITNEKRILFIEKNILLMKNLSKKNYQFIIITNQAGVALKKVSLKKLSIINKNIINFLKKKSINILDLFYCPHHWNDGCNCRKPLPGMFFYASKKYNIDLSKTIYIGDDIRDMEAANNANCKGIYISPKKNFYNLEADLKKCIICTSQNIKLIEDKICSSYEN
jgi:histidinol-phosphate phosphatase family protein